MKCEKCGSKFELTEHHDRDLHLSRNDKRKDKHTIVLCATCHYFADFSKTLKCVHKALLKKYERKMDQLGL